MRFLILAHIPHEPFNTLVREKRAGETIARVMADLKPEAAYFTELNGSRTAILIVDIENASQLPRFAEPLFLNFEADCEFRMVMTPDDLANAGLDAIADKWG